jgi:pimeloyl-ACP methyl ester carboxylesterase
LRQAAADLLVLTRALPTLDLTGDGIADIDGTRIHFVGHSLGGIVGTVYAGLPSALRTATGAMPGGGVADLLRQSVSFGPRIQAGLVAQGLTPGTTLYDQFFRDAQTAVDSGDPWNYIVRAAALRPYHLMQVVGGGTPTSLPDQVVPNSATQRLWFTAALTKVSTAGANAVSRGYVNFIVGDHGSILSPAASLAATVEMQTQTVTFAATNGTTILVSNPAVIQP